MLSPKRLSPDADGVQISVHDGAHTSEDKPSVEKSVSKSPQRKLSTGSDLNDEDDDFYGYRPSKLSQGISLAQRMHDEFLVCKICLEDYKNPKCLDCMHTFCEECIENHVFSESSYKKYSDYREFTCPLCRKRTQMPLGGVRKLPDNLVISGIQTAVAKRRPLAYNLATATCDICRAQIALPKSPTTTTEKALGVAPSPARCFDCNKSLCSACVAAHRSTAVTRLHSLYDPEVMSGVLQDPDALGCPEHRDETVGYYCVQCERCVCVLCALDTAEGQPHFGHEIVDFGLAVTRYEAVLIDLCSRASAETARLEADLLAVTSCQQTIETVKQRIKATTEAFRRQLDVDEKVLLDRLTDVYGRDCQRLIETRPAVRERADRLQSARRRAESVLEHRGVELLLLKKVISDELAKEEEEMSGGGRASYITLPEAIRKKVIYVPGRLNIGELCEEEEGKEGDVAAGECRRSAACEDGCRCRCHRDVDADPAAAAVESRYRRAMAAPVDEATMTDRVTQLVDKGVNTKARGLLHSGGSKRPAAVTRQTSTGSNSTGDSLPEQLAE